jgi:hypothetical protein
MVFPSKVLAMQQIIKRLAFKWKIVSIQRIFAALMLLPLAANAGASSCEVTSGERQTPVIELYTSEGCSSCPPADQWLSTLKSKPVVAQAFHVAYWDYIGWADRFASPAFTARQKNFAAANGLSGIYTPQVILNGHDWRSWRQSRSVEASTKARASITLRRGIGADDFEAHVAPAGATKAWTAYWTVTEHGHNSRVKAGENSGEFLQHDFVVKQYVTSGQFQGPQILKFSAMAAQLDHPRQVNLVVSDGITGEPLQAVSLQCL